MHFVEINEVVMSQIFFAKYVNVHLCLKELVCYGNPELMRVSEQPANYHIE